MVIVYMGSSIISHHVVVDSRVRNLFFVFHLQFTYRRPAGEMCTDWQSWGQYLNVHYILGQSLLHSFVYVALAVSSIILRLEYLQGKI